MTNEKYLGLGVGAWEIHVFIDDEALGPREPSAEALLDIGSLALIKNVQAVMGGELLDTETLKFAAKLKSKKNQLKFVGEIISEELEKFRKARQVLEDYPSVNEDFMDIY